MQGRLLSTARKVLVVELYAVQRAVRAKNKRKTQPEKKETKQTNKKQTQPQPNQTKNKTQGKIIT